MSDAFDLDVAFDNLASHDRMGHAWVQVTCGRGTVAPWARLSGAVSEWHEHGLLLRWFFVRKPPGLRLRFETGDAGLLPAIEAWAAAAEAGDEVRASNLGPYEPEESRFGGPSGLDLAHRHFDLDTGLVMDYQRLGADRRVLGPVLVSLVATNDLYARSVGDGAEIWDIWKRLERAVPAATASVALEREAVEGALLFTPSFLARLDQAEIALLARIQTANQQMAAAMHQARTGPSPPAIGPREWLAAVTVFHWNRWGLTTTELGPMVATMLTWLDGEGGRR